MNNWSFNKPRYHDMNKDRTLKLISACDIEIPLLESDYNYFIKDASYLGYVNDSKNRICKMFEDSDLKEKFKRKVHLSILPDYETNGFFIGYSPNVIFNAIFDVLGINEKSNITFSNKDNIKFELNRIRNILIGQYNKYKAKIDNIGLIDNDYTYKLCEKYKTIMSFIWRAHYYVDYIASLYDKKSLTTYSSKGFITRKGYTYEVENPHISWRNLAQYIAYYSLQLYKKTSNYLYLEYPYKFYERCTKPDENGKQMEYVSTLLVEDKYLDSKFKTFNSEIEEVLKNPYRLDFLLHYKDNNRLTVLETLNPGSMVLKDEDFGTFMEYKSKTSKKHKKEKDNNTALSQLFSKIRFYSYNPEFSEHIVCRLYEQDDSDAGYVGFILDNDYIVLDKFFDEFKDGTCRPTLNAAVYALPLDLYEQLDRDAGKILQYRLTEEKGKELITHKHHTKSENYTKALLEVANKDSVSTLSALEFIISNTGKTSKFQSYKVKRKKKMKSNNDNKNKD